MDMAGAEGETVMHQRGVNRLLGALSHVQQVREVAEMTVAAPDSIPGAVLIEDEHLAGREPTLERIRLVQSS